MSAIIFTLSIDPEETSIDELGLPQEVIDMYINVYTTLLLDPTNTDGAINDMKSYYEKQIAQAANLSSLLNISITSAASILGKKTVVQLDIDGNEIASTNQPSFSTTKNEAKNILGSVEKINKDAFLIADSKNKRAIIVDLTQNKIMWEYISDRYILDAHIVTSDIEPISISSVQYEEKNDTSANLDKYITWINNSLTPITIYSGDITENDFDYTFNLNNYGDQFTSNLLQIGERFTYKFTEIGEYGWFSYPAVNIGKINVTNLKLVPTDYFVITESDGLDSTHTSRVAKIDSYGNKTWSFGEGYLINPKDARPLLNNKILIST